MKTTMLVILFSAFCAAAPATGQALPDAPKPQTSVDRPRLYLPYSAVEAVHHPARGKKNLLALVAVNGFSVGADAFDIRETEKGLKAGVAVEGNTWLVGTKPSARALWARDSLTLGISDLPSVLAYVLRSKPVFFGALTAPAVVGVKHIQGGLAWKKLLLEQSR